jgi:hypothetical protein
MAIPGVFGKMNLKQQTEIVVLNAPASFEAELGKLRGVQVLRALSGVSKLDFALAFVTRQAEVDALTKAIARRAEGDAVIWFAYPKGTSKRYTCDFNRDTGWQALGDAGFEGVRMVAIDEDWSAARFRRAEFMGKMTRAPKYAMSKLGKARAAKRK